MLREIWWAFRADTESVFNAFIEMFEAKCPKAFECAWSERAVLLTFYDFPVKH